jgi:hypothetical protein
MNERVIQIGGNVRVSMSESYPTLDVRTYYEGYDGAMYPSKAGVAISTMNIDKFCHAIEKIGDIFKQYFV